MNQKIIISSNAAWNLHNFRSGLIKALIGHGYEVTAVAPDDEYSPRVRNLGCRFVGLPMDTHGTHPGRDLALLLRYMRVLREEQPSVYLGYTVKPNVYGSMAAHMLRIPVINNIAGLGTTFVEQRLVTRIVRGLYKCGLVRSERVFFQNAEDQELFVRSGLARSDVVDRVPGSGIDLARYIPSHPPAQKGRPFRFLLVARLLRYKGVGEYADAARIVRRKFPDVECQLLGFVDEQNANAITRDEIRSWEGEGIIRYLGTTDDVPRFLADADCVVLPSFYREGVPRTLLEAAAMARPIITTDAIGCRDVVDHGVNGYLCAAKDPVDLAEKMMQMRSLPGEVRLTMGSAGRKKVEIEFDERLVIDKYLDAIARILRPATEEKKRAGAALAGQAK